LFENAPQPNGSPSPTTIERKIFGSCVIWSADSQEEVLDALKKDIYVEKGVWDFDKVCRTSHILATLHASQLHTSVYGGLELRKSVANFDVLQVQIYPFSPTFAHQFDNQ
jgi:hypothetical protein